MDNVELLDQFLYNAKDGPAYHPFPRTQEYNDNFEFLCYKGLIKPRSKDNYELLPEGKIVISMGGYAQWEKAQEPPTPIHISGGNAIIGNNNTGNVQDSSFRDLKATNAIPAENEKQQKAKVSSIEKWIVPIVIGVIIGVILLYIEHKIGFFSEK